MKDNFISDLLCTLGSIGKIAITIAAKATGILSAGIGWVIVCCVSGFFVPMGSSISFVIFKLTGLLTLGWIWILIPLVLDGLCIPVFLELISGHR